MPVDWMQAHGTEFVPMMNNPVLDTITNGFCDMRGRKKKYPKCTVDMLVEGFRSNPATAASA